MRERHHIVTRVLHAYMALAVLYQVIQYYLMQFFPSVKAYGRVLFMIHKSNGVLVIVVALLMLFWQWRVGRPALPNMQPWQRLLARVNLSLLYLLVCVMSLSGYVMSSMANRGFDIYGLFPMPLWVSAGTFPKGLAHSVHEWTSYVLIFCLLLHFAAIWYHNVILKDNLLKRMMVP